MSTTTTKERMTLYGTMAALPVAGAAGYTTADIIHYGGPAIQVNYTASTFTSSSDSDGFIYRSIYYGARSNNGADMKTGSWAPTEDTIFAGKIMRTHDSSSFYTTSNSDYIRNYTVRDGAKAKLAGIVRSDQEVMFAVGQGMAMMFASGSIISDGAAASTSPLAILALDLFWTSNGETIIDPEYGNWLPDGESEVRGFAGFVVERDEGAQEARGFGWVDVGFDGETLTIYDWAYNTDGNILAGQTTAVPGGVGLAALAMGAAGLRRRRKRSA